MSELDQITQNQAIILVYNQEKVINCIFRCIFRNEFTQIMFEKSCIPLFCVILFIVSKAVH